MLSFNKYLNPIYRNIDEIYDFTSVQSTNDVEKEENAYLKNVEQLNINYVRKLLDRLKNTEKEIEDQVALIEDQTGDDKSEAVKVYNQLIKRAFSIVDQINRELYIVDSPYFGKIVIDRNQTEKYPSAEITSYIGKFALFDPDSKKVLITDWRAPIANLYYTNSGPKKGIKFNTPVGEFTGDLKSKRQFDISGGRIKNLYDAKSGNVSADEFLLSHLSKRLGKKLTDIVATIQDEQNSIIRSDIDTPIILQGVAGSGKTTIMLHRLAYIFYTFPEKVHPDKSLIIAPNKVFLEYISNVLPSLGITGVESNTFIFWAKKILNIPDKQTVYTDSNTPHFRGIKGSIEYINSLEQFFNKYEEEILENLPFSEYDAVKRKYYELKARNKDIFVNERISLAIEYAYFASNIGRKSVSDTTKEKIDNYIKNKLEIKNIYLEFLKSLEDNQLYASTLSTMKKRMFSQEDLPALVWLYFKLNGITTNLKEYVVIDEAQDMTPFEIYVLTQTAKNGNIFLAGDIAQSIIPPYSIQNWNPISKIISDISSGEIKYFQLNKCYRTTIEVIEYSNKILKKYFPSDYVLPEAVLRHGDKVSEIKIKDIASVINKQYDLGSSSVAILTKDENKANEVFNYLQKKKLNRKVYLYNEEGYKTGTIVLPIQKAKGLEYDCVIINNFEDFDLNKSEDARLFYVASTRALHRLYIIRNEK